VEQPLALALHFSHQSYGIKYSSAVCNLSWSEFAPLHLIEWKEEFCERQREQERGEHCLESRK